mgnify:FL=1|tara:strand:+ start:1302 stop:1484 length:183 start_codon:yes stop_codon:yes gene_type:complete
MAYPTNPIYKLMKNGEDASEPDGVETMEGHIRKVIPFKSDNSDYQKYLKWAETNTAEPAD